MKVEHIYRRQNDGRTVPVTIYTDKCPVAGGCWYDQLRRKSRFSSDRSAFSFGRLWGTDMFLLTAGYGHDSPSKVWLSFRAFELDTEKFKEVAGDYGCEERFCDKAASILKTSGRYDCCVQANWVNRRLYDLVEAMADAGVNVVVDPEYFPPRGYHRSVRV